jgi:hypothetical protein
MSTLTFVHIILWILIGLIFTYGMTIDQFQQTLIAQYGTRVLDIALIITGLINVVHTVAMSPLVVWFQFILEIITIGLLDFALTGKRDRRNIKPKSIMLFVLIFAITTILGVLIQYLYG